MGSSQILLLSLSGQKPLPTQLPATAPDLSHTILCHFCHPDPACEQGEELSELGLRAL